LIHVPLECREIPLSTVFFTDEENASTKLEVKKKFKNRVDQLKEEATLTCDNIKSHNKAHE